MRFLLDANLPPRLVWEFSRLGHECIHVMNALSADAEDRRIADLAREQDMVLVSRDADFVSLSRLGVLGGALIWVRTGNLSARATCALLRTKLPDAIASVAAGNRITIIA